MFWQDVSKKLNFNEGEITTLVSEEHLIPLGKPNKFGRKTFAGVYILRLAVDEEWLDQAETILQSSGGETTRNINALRYFKTEQRSSQKRVPRKTR